MTRGDRSRTIQSTLLTRSRTTRERLKRVFQRVPSITLAIILFVSVVACLVGCKRKPSSGDEGTPIVVKIVHGPELRAFMSSAREQFAMRKPRLSNGDPVRVELVSEMGLNAAFKIAHGDLKTEAWLAPSTPLVNYTNLTRINLGPEQVDCTPLFETPIVLASRTDQVGLTGAKDNVFSWNSFFTTRGTAEVEGGTFAPSFSHAQPRASTTGLASLVQLSVLALGGATPTVESLGTPAAQAKLRAYQSLVFAYPLSENYLLAKTANSSGKRPRFALTTEQQLLQFNQQSGGENKLVALFPSEGSYVQQYQLCTSDADWVSPGHRAAIAKFRDFLRSPALQRDAARLGFRSVVASTPPPESTPADPNTPAGKATPEPLPAPIEFQPRTFPRLEAPISGDLVQYLLKAWPELRRSAALVLVLDASGSMEGDPIEVGKEQFRKLLAQSSTNDLKGLVTFNSDSQVLSRLVPNTSEVIQKIDPIQSLGGSAVYDGIRDALELASDKKLIEYRKLIVVYTDGSDKNSDISLSSLLSLVHQKAESNDISLVIVAIDGEGADYTDLERIAAAADGVFRKSALIDMNNIFQEISKSF